MTDINLEQAKTSDDVDSMASMREKHRRTRVVWQGHPNDPTLEDRPEEIDELPEGKDIKPPEEKVEVAPTETRPSAPPLEHEGRKFKYSNQEEAERAQEEAAKRMHEATTELAELKKRLEEMEKAKEAIPRPEPSENMETQVASTWKEIDGLDPYEDGYEGKRAKLFAKLLNLPPVIDDSYIDRKVEEKLDRERQIARQKADEDAQAAASRQAAIQMAKEAGLNMDDSNVSRLFWNALSGAPYHERVTLNEQVDFMVKEVKDFYSNLAKEMGKTTPPQNILERGGNTPIKETKQEEEKPLTISEMKEKWRERWRL